MVEYPFGSHYLEVDGGARLHYLDEGSGEPVLMVHGNPTWSFYYRHLVAGLRGRYRVVAPDHVGCGLSDKPQDYPYVLSRHIANLERLAEHLDLRGITLVVHDWGGPIGFGFAGRHPERVRRLVVFNTAAFRSRFFPWPLSLARAPLVGDLMVRGLNLFAWLATWVAVHHHERMTPAVRAAYLAPYGSWADRIATLRFVQDIPTHPGHPSYPTLVEVERSLERLRDLPTLLVWGMRDWVFTPAFLAEWERRFPHARVHRVADAGHYVVEDARERILAWLQAFLAEPVAAG